MDEPHPKRVIVKLSGERLSGRQAGSFSSFSSNSLRRTVAELTTLHDAGYQVAIVVGAGNLLRGGQSAVFTDRATADTAGMLATVMNALLLADALTATGYTARAYSAVSMPSHVTPYRFREVRQRLEAGEIAIVGGGTGAPFFTTDTAAALRARELQASVILKATQVDGVYSADPKKDPTATRYDRLSYAEVLEQRLAVMDLAAFEICRGGKIEIRVFDGAAENHFLRALTEPGFATVITS